jgi:hypothetical protein
MFFGAPEFVRVRSSSFEFVRVRSSSFEFVRSKSQGAVESSRPTKTSINVDLTSQKVSNSAAGVKVRSSSIDFDHSP